MGDYLILELMLSKGFEEWLCVEIPGGACFMLANVKGWPGCWITSYFPHISPHMTTLDLSRLVYYP